MSDNVVQFPGQPGKSEKPSKFVTGKRFWRLFGIVVLILAVLSLYLFRDALNLDGLRRSLVNLNAQVEDNYGAHTFGVHSSNRYGLYDGGLAVASVSGLELYDEVSDTMEKLGKSMTNPALVVEDNLVMAYDVGGKSLVIGNQYMEEVLSVETETAIFDGDLSEKGAMVYAMDGDGSKASLIVCNEKHQEIYKWHSATKFMSLCTVNSDGSNIAAISLGQSDGIYQSSLSYFDTSLEGEQLSVPLGDQIIFDVEYLTDDNLVAIGQHNAQFLDGSGNLLNLYDFQGYSLDQFVYWDNGDVTLLMRGYGDGNENFMVTLDKTGREVSNAVVDGIVLHTSASDKYLAVLTSTDLKIFRQDLTLYAKGENIIGMAAALMQDDGSCLLIGGGKAELFLP